MGDDGANIVGILAALLAIAGIFVGGYAILNDDVGEPVDIAKIEARIAAMEIQIASNVQDIVTLDNSDQSLQNQIQNLDNGYYSSTSTRNLRDDINDVDDIQDDIRNCLEDFSIDEDFEELENCLDDI